MSTPQYDLAVIGGGPGGYVAAICGARRGLRVLLVEKDALGGTCLNRGCIPTKSFYYDAKRFHDVKTSPVFGGTKTLTVDSRKMLARKREAVARLTDGLEKILRSHRIEVRRGFGELVSPQTVRLHALDGTTAEHAARHVILATGSRPAAPGFIPVDGRLVQTTDEALDDERIPEEAVIIGGGVIGLEIAAIWLNLGVRVTILELLPDIIANEDAEIRRVMKRLLEQRGARLHLNAQTKELSPGEEAVNVTFQDQSGTIRTLTADRVLVATGRVPVLNGIDAKALKLETEGPYVKVNHRLESSLPGVYAIGDLVGGMLLAHKATAEAEVAVENILGGSRTVRAELIPRCIWGPTEIAAVGLTEDQARADGRPIRIGKFPFTASAAAHARGDDQGFVKIIGDADSGEILGVHILGDHATDLIAEPVTAMAMESAVEDLFQGIKPHPTLSETVMEAALAWQGSAIHLPAA